MQDFSAYIEHWGTFYFTVAAVSGTLLGLLFVAVSLNVDTMRRTKFSDLRIMGYQTYFNYLMVLLVALIFLIPEQTQTGMGIMVLLVGAAGVTVSIRQIQSAERNPEHPILGAYFYKPLFMLQISAVGFVCFAGMMILAILVLAGQALGVSLLFIPVAALIVSATETTWNFLTHGNYHAPEEHGANN